MFLCACPWAPLTNSTRSKLWHCAWSWGASMCIFKNQSACVPAHVPNYKNPLYLFCGTVLDLGDPQYVFAKICVPLCLPMWPFTKLTIYILWRCAWSWGAPICNCQNHCAFVPAHVTHSQNPLYLSFDAVLDFWDPQYVFISNCYLLVDGKSCLISRLCLTRRPRLLQSIIGSV